MAKNVKINSVVYAEVPQVSIPLAEGQGTAVFYDTTGATAASGDILTGKIGLYRERLCCRFHGQ